MWFVIFSLYMHIFVFMHSKYFAYFISWMYLGWYINLKNYLSNELLDFECTELQILYALPYELYDNISFHFFHWGHFNWNIKKFGNMINPFLFINEWSKFQYMILSDDLLQMNTLIKGLVEVFELFKGNIRAIILPQSAAFTKLVPRLPGLVLIAQANTQ